MRLEFRRGLLEACGLRVRNELLSVVSLLLQTKIETCDADSIFDRQVITIGQRSTATLVSCYPSFADKESRSTARSSKNRRPVRV